MENEDKQSEEILKKITDEIKSDEIKSKIPAVLTPDGLFDAINKITQDYKKNHNI